MVVPGLRPHGLRGDLGEPMKKIVLLLMLALFLNGCVSSQRTLALDEALAQCPFDGVMECQDDFCQIKCNDVNTTILCNFQERGGFFDLGSHDCVVLPKHFDEVQQPEPKFECSISFTGETMVKSGDCTQEEIQAAIKTKQESLIKRGSINETVECDFEGRRLFVGTCMMTNQENISERGRTCNFTLNGTALCWDLPFSSDPQSPRQAFCMNLSQAGGKDCKIIPNPMANETSKEMKDYFGGK